MTVTLDGTELFGANEDRSQSRGNVTINSVFGEDSDKTILTGLESQETFDLTGIATGIRISQQSGFSSDAKTALAEWVAEMEALVDAKQGSGYTLDDSDERGESKNVVIQSFGWTYNQGEPFQVMWDLSVVWANGSMTSETTSADTVSPDSTWTLDGNDLGGLISMRERKRQDLRPVLIALADPGGNEVLAESGATRRVIIRGEKTDDLSTGGTDERNSFDDAMQKLVGTDSIVVYDSPFPGRSKNVMVRDYESIRTAGRTRIGEYSLDLIEGES